MIPPPPRSTLFPYTTLFRSVVAGLGRQIEGDRQAGLALGEVAPIELVRLRRRRVPRIRSEEHTSELQSLTNLVCRLLLEKKKKKNKTSKIIKTHKHKSVPKL